MGQERQAVQVHGVGEAGCAGTDRNMVRSLPELRTAGKWLATEVASVFSHTQGKPGGD